MRYYPLATSWSLPLILIAVFAGMVVSPSETKADEQPNIVLIMADDLGFADLGCYGSEIETPQLDRLAAGGLRFSQFYNTSKCHSSRVSLLTGLYSFQAGEELLSHGVTLAEVLREAGYFTAMSGKWHLKKEPTDRGFHRFFGHLSGMTDFFVGDNTFRLNGKPFTDFDKDFYTTDVMTDYGIRFIDEARETEKPFFLYLAYNAPHYPLQAPEEDVQKYRGKYKQGWDKLRTQRYAKQQELGVIESSTKLSPRPEYVPAWEELTAEERDWEDFRMATYAAMVDRLDCNIGRLVEHLKEHDQFDNTILMFCSDNGACPFERTKDASKMPWEPRSFWTYDAGWAHAGNTPFRWYKQNQHEGGISSPMIAHWPSGLKTSPGSITDQPGHLIDFMATVIELGQGEYPAERDGKPIEPLMGKSLVPIFRGETRPGHDWLYFQFTNNRAIREGDFKLVSARGGKWELYDLSQDRSELNDLADQHPEMVERLSGLWHRVAKDVDKAPPRVRRPVSQKSPALSRDYRASLKEKNKD